MVDIAIEMLDYDALTRLRDACNRRLLGLRRSEGLTLSELLRLLEDVKTVLRDQGKHWYSLERWRWEDGQIRFWLNPIDQTHYRMGWFGIDDLLAWTEEQGPIVIASEPDVDGSDDANCMQDINTRSAGVVFGWN